MKRKFETPGNDTSKVEVATVTASGFWLVVDAERLFVPFADFPWFKDVSRETLSNVERPQPHHLYWPDLDVDLAVASIRDPSGFPLVSGRKAS
jgi:hypothetical protein